MAKKATTEELAKQGFGEAVCVECEHDDSCGTCFVEGVDEYEYDPVSGETDKKCVQCLSRNAEGNCEHFKKMPPPKKRRAR